MPEQLELFAAAARFASIGILAAVSVALFRSARKNWAGRLTVMFAISVCGYLLDTSSNLWEMLGVWLPVLEFVSAAAPFLLWLVAQATLVSGFRPRGWHWLALILFSLLGASTHHIDDSSELSVQVLWVYNIGRVGLLSAAILKALDSYRCNSRDVRLRNRSRFVSITVATSIAVIFVELVGMYYLDQKALETINGIIVLAISVMIAPSLHRMKLGDSGNYKNSVNAGGMAIVPQSSLSDTERTVLATIRREMETNHRFRDPQLTVASFAKEVGIAEYRLRQIVNGNLGFRNFNAFVNHYRISWIKEALADTRHARLPILTIAMDAGFASIAPFNKIFKEMTGETPSAYRSRMRNTTQKIEDPTDNGLDNGLIVTLYDRFSEYLTEKKIEETEPANTRTA